MKIYKINKIILQDKYIAIVIVLCYNISGTEKYKKFMEVLNMEGNGKSYAVGSLILGIASVILGFLIFPLGIVCGILAIVLARKAKNLGYVDGIRTAGVVLGVIGLIIAGIILLSAIFLAGAGVGAQGVYDNHWVF